MYSSLGYFFNMLESSFLELTTIGYPERVFCLSETIKSSPFLLLLLRSPDTVGDDAPNICTVKLPPTYRCHKMSHIFSPKNKYS